MRKKTMEKKTKRWLAAFMAAFLCMGAAELTMPMTVKAAQDSETVAVTTTQRCSIWSAPATVEENRQKYVDAGYQITVYPEVIQSELGDGKTFYRTVKGAYVLCRCVEGQEEEELVKEFQYRSNGTVSGFCEYNANGALVRETDYNPIGMVNKIREYGTNGTLVRETIYSGSGIVWRVDEYDANGNCVKTTAYNDDGTVKRYQTDEYDANGNHVKTTYYNADGTVESYFICEYDANGNLVKLTFYNADGTVGGYEIHEYDANGNYVKTTNYDADGTIARP